MLILVTLTVLTDPDVAGDDEGDDPGTARAVDGKRHHGLAAHSGYLCRLLPVAVPALCLLH